MKPRHLPFAFRSISAACAVFLLAACSDKKDAAEDTGPQKTAEQLYAEAQSQLKGGDHKGAITAFEEVERQYPYSDLALRAQIMSAYTSYDHHKYDDAVATLEQFLQMHPSHERAPYAYYLKALCYYEQISDVGRDQKMTQLALNALRDVGNRYPDSEYARDARIKLDLAYDHLAGKEMEVGRYYEKRGEYLAAINRFKTVVEKYETTTHTPEALLRLTESYTALGVPEEAQKYAAVLGHNFPGTPWYREAYALLEPEKAKSYPVAGGKKSSGWKEWVPGL